MLSYNSDAVYLCEYDRLMRSVAVNLAKTILHLQVLRLRSPNGLNVIIPFAVLVGYRINADALHYIYKKAS